VDVLFLTQVAADGQGRAALTPDLSSSFVDGPRQAWTFRFGAGSYDHTGALAGQANGHGLANAPAGAGDDGYLAG
jgi:hypothetical protein